MSMYIDPEYSFLENLPAGPETTKETIDCFRKFLPTVVPPQRLAEGVTVKHFVIPGPEDNIQNNFYVYSPDEETKELRPVMLWMHGGGLIAGEASQDLTSCSSLSFILNISVVSANYRLSPEHPFPAALDDLHNILKWIHDHSELLGIDVNRIAVGGDSAGGGLAAALAQRERDTKQYNFVFQYLVYPMLDDRTCLCEHSPAIGKYVWTAANNKFAWQSYLKDIPIGDEKVPSYAVPSRANSLSGLPPALIIVGELDLFRDENVEYAKRLWKAGVSTELIVYPGVYHCFDLHLTSKVSCDFRSRSVEALRRALFPK